MKKKIADGTTEKTTFSNWSVKSNPRRQGSTWGPNMLSPFGAQTMDKFEFMLSGVVDVTQDLWLLRGNLTLSPRPNPGHEEYHSFRIYLKGVTRSRSTIKRVALRLNRHHVDPAASHQ